MTLQSKHNSTCLVLCKLSILRVLTTTFWSKCYILNPYITKCPAMWNMTVVSQPYDTCLFSSAHPQSQLCSLFVMQPLTTSAYAPCPNKVLCTQVCSDPKYHDIQAEFCLIWFIQGSKLLELCISRELTSTQPGGGRELCKDFFIGMHSWRKNIDMPLYGKCHHKM